MRTHCMIRVRWERTGHFKAVSMDLRGRVDASSTSSAESAVIACAAKVLLCGGGEVSITAPRRPLKRIDEITTQAGTGDWHAFECVLKGSLTQIDLLPGGVQ